MSKRKLVWFLLALSCFALMFVIMVFDLPRPRPQPLLEISVLVPSQASEDFAAVRQGIDQAADELNVEVRFLTLTNRNDSDEQEAMLRREVEGGTDAVIIAAADGVAISPAIDELYRKVPIVAVTSPVDSKRVTATITSDDYAMGIALADQMLVSGELPERVLILKSSHNSTAINNRYRGLYYVLADAGCTVESYDLPHNMDAANELMTELMATQTGVVVALEKPVLESVAQLAGEDVTIYGLGNSNLIASMLEEDKIAATVVCNDFSIGYLAMQAAVNSINSKPYTGSATVDFRVVTKNNMYDTELQKLIFPFVR